MTVHRTGGRLSRRWVRVGLVTGLLAFVIAAVVYTVPELIAGQSAASGSRATSIFGGSSRDHRSSKTPATTTTTSTSTTPAETTATTPQGEATTPTVTEEAQPTVTVTTPAPTVTTPAPTATTPQATTPAPDAGTATTPGADGAPASP